MIYLPDRFLTVFIDPIRYFHIESAEAAILFTNLYLDYLTLFTTMFFIKAIRYPSSLRLSFERKTLNDRLGKIRFIYALKLEIVHNKKEKP